MPERRGKPKRQPPLHIPLPLEKLVDGLLAVDPKQMAAKKQAATKKPRPKK
jgi:hypothetical protein